MKRKKGGLQKRSLKEESGPSVTLIIQSNSHLIAEDHSEKTPILSEGSKL